MTSIHVFKSEFFTLLKSCWVSASVECKTITQKVRLNSLVGGMYGNRVGVTFFQNNHLMSSDCETKDFE